MDTPFLTDHHESGKRSGFGKIGKKIKKAFGNLSRKASPEPDEDGGQSGMTTPKLSRFGSFSRGIKMFSSNSQNTSKASLNIDINTSPTKDQIDSNIPSGAQTPYSRSGSPDSIASYKSTRSVLEKAAVKIKKSLGIKQKYNKREISNPQAEITQKTLFRAHEDATIHTVDRWNDLPDVSVETDILNNAYYQPDMRRQESIFQMYKSEILYLQELEFLLKNLIYPLSQISVSFVGFPIILQIFIENIVQIHNGHHIFLKNLEYLYNSGSFINSSTEILQTLLSVTRDSYIIFLSQFSDTLEMLDEFAEKAFEAIPASTLVHGKRLLFNFAKRLQFYFDLSKNMIDILPDSFPDYYGFREIKYQLEGLFTQVENRKLFLESRKQIEFILKHTNWTLLPQVPMLLPPIPITNDIFINPCNPLILNGEFIDIQYNSKRVERIKLVLFPEKLLILRPNLAAGTELYRCLYPLIHVSEIDILDISDLNGATTKFQIKCNNLKFVHILQATHENIKRLWIDKLSAMKSNFNHEEQKRKELLSLVRKKQVPEKLPREIIDLESFAHSPRLLDLSRIIAQQRGFAAKLCIRIDDIRCKVLLRDQRTGEYDALGICRLSLQSFENSHRVKFTIKLESTDKLYVNCWINEIEAIVQPHSNRQIIILCPLLHKESNENLAIQFKNELERDKIFKSILDAKIGDPISQNEDQEKQGNADAFKYETDLDFLPNEMEHYDYRQQDVPGSCDFIPDEFNLSDEKLVFQSWMNTVLKLQHDPNELKRGKWNSLGNGSISILTSKPMISNAGDNPVLDVKEMFARLCFQKHDDKTIPLNSKIACFCPQLSVLSKRVIGLGLAIDDTNPRPMWLCCVFSSPEIAFKVSEILESWKVIRINLHEYETGSYRIPRKASPPPSLAHSKVHQEEAGNSKTPMISKQMPRNYISSYAQYNNQNYSSYNRRHHNPNNQNTGTKIINNYNTNNNNASNISYNNSLNQNSSYRASNTNASNNFRKKFDNSSRYQGKKEDKANIAIAREVKEPAPLNKLYNLSLETKKSYKSYSRDSMNSNSNRNSRSMNGSKSFSNSSGSPSDSVKEKEIDAKVVSIQAVTESMSSLFQTLDFKIDPEITDSENYFSCDEDDSEEFFDCETE